MTNNTTVRAVAAKVKIGNIELTGLQFPDGSYHLGVNQLRSELHITKSDQTGKKYLQPLLDADLSKLSKAKVEGIDKPYQTMSLDLVLEAIVVYGKLGNQICIDLCIGLAMESLERRFDHAFGTKRTEEDRNERLAIRMAGKHTRLSLTDSIKGYIETHETSENYRKFIYSNVTDCLYKHVIGLSAKKASASLGLKDSSKLRDVFAPDIISELDGAEKFCVKLIDRWNHEPLDAMKVTLERNMVTRFHTVRFAA